MRDENEDGLAVLPLSSTLAPPSHVIPLVPDRRSDQSVQETERLIYYLAVPVRPAVPRAGVCRHTEISIVRFAVRPVVDAVWLTANTGRLRESCLRTCIVLIEYVTWPRRRWILAVGFPRGIVIPIRLCDKTHHKLTGVDTAISLCWDSETRRPLSVLQ